MVKIDKETKAKIEKALNTKIKTKPNKSYCAIWAKVNKVNHLILCYFVSKKSHKLCLPWSSINLADNNNLKEIIERFLKFKANHSISKEIDKLEKELKQAELI